MAKKEQGPVKCYFCGEDVLAQQITSLPPIPTAVFHLSGQLRYKFNLCRKCSEAAMVALGDLRRDYQNKLRSNDRPRNAGSPAAGLAEAALDDFDEDDRPPWWEGRKEEKK